VQSGGVVPLQSASVVGQLRRCKPGGRLSPRYGQALRLRAVKPTPSASKINQMTSRSAKMTS
jgi:hypothetical protein